MPLDRDGNFLGSVPLAFERLAEYIDIAQIGNRPKLVERISSDLESDPNVHPQDVIYGGVNMMALLQTHAGYDFMTLAQKGGGVTGSPAIFGFNICAWIDHVRAGRPQRKLLDVIERAITAEVATGADLGATHGKYVYAVVTLLHTYQRERGRNMATAARQIRESMRGKEGAAAIELKPELWLPH